MKHTTEKVSVTGVSNGRKLPGVDQLVVEEPLEIVLSYVHAGATRQRSIAITMRTPGDDFDLVRGFLYAEGIVHSPDDILCIVHRGKQALQGRSSNVVSVTLAPTIHLDIEKFQRHFLANSACGVCGKASLEQLEDIGCVAVENDDFSIRESSILALPQAARELQSLFELTGGVHAAAAFDANGTIRYLREDIGRHNALDKLMGALREPGDIEFSELGLFVSSRASYELLQKAAMAGCPLFAAVGAPSSLAVELAKEFDITLLGFVREDRFNIYNRPDRIQNLG